MASGHACASTESCAFVYNERFELDGPTLRAEVAELADAQASGACGRKVVEVQILSSAPITYSDPESVRACAPESFPRARNRAQ